MKKLKSDLAINGGTPAFTKKLLVGKPNIPYTLEFYNMLDDIFTREVLTNNGYYVRKMESVFEQFLGINHVVAVSSATTGLMIAAKAMGLTGKIIMPAYTFPATATAMQWIGLEPVFCDVYDYWLDPRLVKNQIEYSLKAKVPVSAILGVHPYGIPKYCDGMQEIANRYGIKLFYDAAASFGVTQNGRSVLHFGECSVVSLHATKIINGFEGGFIATDNDELAEKCRHMRNFGFAGKEYSEGQGINGKMSEAHAAMALASFADYDSLVAHNQLITSEYEYYLPEFTSSPEYLGDGDYSYHYAVCRIEDGKRDYLLDVLTAEGVMARRYYWPGVHKTQEIWKDACLPETDKIASEVICLPTGKQMTVVDAETIASIINVALEE
jgi:dTDP-4-amino-4,6-dideoxygalactose transaminase